MAKCQRKCPMGGGWSPVYTTKGHGLRTSNGKASVFSDAARPRCRLPLSLGGDAAYLTYQVLIFIGRTEVVGPFIPEEVRP